MLTGVKLVEILDAYLKDKGLSRRQFCTKFDIPNSTIATWKHKNILPPLETIDRIANFMNIPLSSLVCTEDNKIKLPNAETACSGRIRTSKEILEILDSYLKPKNITRKQFCELTKIPPSTLGNLKTKNMLPSIELAGKIARFMNVPLDWLVFGDLPSGKRGSKTALMNIHFDMVKKYNRLSPKEQQIVSKLIDIIGGKKNEHHNRK